MYVYSLKTVEVKMIANQVAGYVCYLETNPDGRLLEVLKAWLF